MRHLRRHLRLMRHLHSRSVGHIGLRLLWRHSWLRKVVLRLLGRHFRHFHHLHSRSSFCLARFQVRARALRVGVWSLGNHRGRPRMSSQRRRPCRPRRRPPKTCRRIRRPPSREIVAGNATAHVGQSAIANLCRIPSTAFSTGASFRFVCVSHSTVVIMGMAVQSLLQKFVRSVSDFACRCFSEKMCASG
jgi:hypothetical protein